MSESINNPTQRRETLKDIIRQLHEGKSVADVQAEFAELLADVGGDEIARIEQELMDEGLPAEEITRLCDVHVAAFRASLDQPAAPVEAAPAPSGGLIPLNVGALTVEQIDMLLRTLPVDVTFVDEHDEVRYFSQTRERIFQRSPAIIGRKVQNCHPPQSVHRVQEILDDFRAGKQDVAEFWIQMGGKFIHIRYFALRDEAGAYRGTLEVSQDAAHVRALEGEKRLLDARE
jgi:DUF438 domain-containing protein